VDRARPARSIRASSITLWISGSLWQAAGMTLTVAFSQNCCASGREHAAGAWTQRFADGTQVLTGDWLRTVGPRLR